MMKSLMVMISFGNSFYQEIIADIYIVDLTVQRYVFLKTRFFYPVCTGECMAKRDKRLRLGMEFVCSDKRKQEIEFNMLDYCFRCMLNSKYKKI